MAAETAGQEDENLTEETLPEEEMLKMGLPVSFGSKKQAKEEGQKEPSQKKRRYFRHHEA